MGSDNSSEDTFKRANKLAKEINCTHYNMKISEITKAFENCLATSFNLSQNERPKFESKGGSKIEDLALQNI